MTKKAMVIALPYKEQEIVSPQETGRYIDVLTRHESPVTGFRWEYSRYMDGMIAQNPYHLYFTTDEEIKEGEWGIFQGLGEPKIKRAFNDSKSGIYKKIVATTNPDLWFKPNSEEEGYSSVKKPLIPRIGTDFLEAYVREQGTIKEVLLEYEIEDRTKQWSNFNNPLINLITKLKLRPNGTVIIHPIKERAWTDEQVLDMLAKYGADVSYAAITDKSIPYCKDWFNQNYPKL